MIAMKCLTFARTLIKKSFSGRLEKNHFLYVIQSLDASQLHTSQPSKNLKKVKEEKVHIWRGMSIDTLGKALNKSPKEMQELIEYSYVKPNEIDREGKINNITVLEMMVKLCGKKLIVVQPPGVNKERKSFDFERTPLPPHSKMVKRPPIVTVMGHVDHGKTTLLDTLRNTSVVAGEFGGITQHIGAFSVALKGKEKVTFLDTPGHAAFSTMRSRGARVTDIVVLVVAADDGVMEQTVESIKMADKAGVPIVVALNKIDKPGANLERCKDILLECGVQVEEYGGDVQVVPISALKGTNIDKLIEAILLQAEVMDLRGDPDGMVEGVIVESKIEQKNGRLSTTLIKRGTLRKGQILISGETCARVRGMLNSEGKNLEKATLSTPVQILGWDELPVAGDEVFQVRTQREAKRIIKSRIANRLRQKQINDAEAIQKREEKVQKRLMEEKECFFRSKEVLDDYSKDNYLGLVIKGDVNGSVEAILDVINTYGHHDECRLDVIHSGVGAINETDLTMAETFGGIIYSFNLPKNPKIEQMAAEKSIEIRKFNIIYRLVEDLQSELSLRIPEKNYDKVLGEAEVIQHFDITVGRKKVPVAGCNCVTGELQKKAKFRVIRADTIVFDGELDSLKHFKNEVPTVRKGSDCGIMLKDYSGTFQMGDKIVCYEVAPLRQKTSWNPGF